MPLKTHIKSSSRQKIKFAKTIKFRIIYANVSHNCDLGNILVLLYHKNTKKGADHPSKSEIAKAFTPLKSTLPLASVGISSTMNI